MLRGLSSRTKILRGFQPKQFWHLQAILHEQMLFLLNFSVKYCRNDRSNDSFSPIGLVMSTDGRSDNCRLMRTKNSMWDDSNVIFCNSKLFYFWSGSVL